MILRPRASAFGASTWVLQQLEASRIATDVAPAKEGVSERLARDIQEILC
jgi:hypothetical protein